jgi:hypothetical protein
MEERGERKREEEEEEEERFGREEQLSEDRVRIRNIQSSAKALFTSHANLKYFFFHLSHQIFQRMHGALNVGKKR